MYSKLIVKNKYFQVFEAFNSNDTLVYIIAGGVTGFLLIVLVIVVASLCRSRKDKEVKARRRQAQKDQRRLEGNETMQRTQVYINDIVAEAEDAEDSIDCIEKPVNYSDIWSSNVDSRDPTGYHPAPQGPHNNNSYNPVIGHQGHHWNTSESGDFRQHQVVSPFQQELQQRLQQHALHQAPSAGGVHSYNVRMQESHVPTYQNWGAGAGGSALPPAPTAVSMVGRESKNTPSDDGTTTTSSTDCTSSYYDSDQHPHILAATPSRDEKQYPHHHHETKPAVVRSSSNSSNQSRNHSSSSNNHGSGSHTTVDVAAAINSSDLRRKRVESLV